MYFDSFSVFSAFFHVIVASFHPNYLHSFHLSQRHIMSNFKVLIIGAGPTGLIAAHCFAKAGIDYEILERRASLDDNEGASAAIWPNSARVFAQLGIIDEALKTYFPGIKWKSNLIADGTVLGKSDVMGMPEV